MDVDAAKAVGPCEFPAFPPPTHKHTRSGTNTLKTKSPQSCHAFRPTLKFRGEGGGEGNIEIRG